MLTKIYVNGFKSLSNFELTLKSGLNVLIGPNAAGKTNICQAVGLLASTADNSLIDYILSIGEVNSIFTFSFPSREAQQSRSKRITISCDGKTSGFGEREENINIKYKYFLKFELKEELEIIEENIKIYRKTSNKQFKLILKARAGKQRIIARIKDVNLIKPVIGLEEVLDKVEKEKRKSFTISSPKMKGRYLLSSLSNLFFVAYLVQEDLIKSKTFNIDPHVARKPSSPIEKYEILSDGGRLSNALYEMSKNKKDYFKELNSFLRGIFPDFKKLTPEFFEQTKRSFSITDKRGSKFFADSLSDGTIKIIALLVGIYSQQPSTTIIEEPENYLHPWACKYMIEYFREVFEDQVCLLTTHSETILNSISPKEIIICENDRGTTKISRLKNIKEIQEIIKITGFGCGYHYLTGSFGGTPL